MAAPVMAAICQISLIYGPNQEHYYMYEKGKNLKRTQPTCNPQLFI